MSTESNSQSDLRLVSGGDYTHIPSQILAEYHYRFHSDTYNAFSHLLTDQLKQTFGKADPLHVLVMNLLIDASFERLGESFFMGAERYLDMVLITFDNADLMKAAQGHLGNFWVNEPRYVKFNQVMQLVGRLAGELASVPDRGGRMAAYWMNAALTLVQAAHTAHRKGDLKVEKSYLEEKVRRTKQLLEMADEEITGLSKEKSQGADTR